MSISLKTIAKSILSERQKGLIRRIKFSFAKNLPSRRRAFSHMMGIISERPIGLNLETRTLCNAKCKFCARSKKRMGDKVMAMELFKKISSEYSSMGGGMLGFSPLVADPLLDPMLMERIRTIKDQYPNIVPNIYTNAIGFSNYSDEDIAFMLKSIHHMDISIGGLDRAGYKEMFGVDSFQTVWESLNRISEINRGLEIPRNVYMHIRTNRKKDILNSNLLDVLTKEYRFACRDISDSFSDWGGLLNANDLPDGASLKRIDNASSRISCLIPMMNMMIMPDGEVLACTCMDVQRELVAGNVNNSSLKDIWNGPVFKGIRDSFATGEVKNICRTCAYYMPYDECFSAPKLAGYSPSDNFWDFASG